MRGDVRTAATTAMVLMPRSPVSPDGAPRPPEIGGPRRAAALRGFVDDIAVLFAIMLGRDMVQRGSIVVPDGPGSTDAPSGPH